MDQIKTQKNVTKRLSQIIKPTALNALHEKIALNNSSPNSRIRGNFGSERTSIILLGLPNISNNIIEYDNEEDNDTVSKEHNNSSQHISLYDNRDIKMNIDKLVNKSVITTRANLNGNKTCKLLFFYCYTI